MPCLLENDLPRMHTAAKNAGFKLKLCRFPSDPALQAQWYTAIEPFQSKNRRSRQHHALNQLCSLHFKPSDFIYSDLIEGSIPTIFSPLSTSELWKLNRKRAYARCCVPDCQTSAHFNLYPFVAEHAEVDSELTRRRYKLWVRTLQVAPCQTRPDVWICRRHFVHGFPADLADCFNVDWVPTLFLEGIPRNPCREFSVVLQRLPDDVLEDGPENPDLDAPFCRLCLGQNVPMQSMFLDSSAGQRLAELIEQFTDIRVDSLLDSNGSVCIECLEKLAQMEEMERVRARWNANNVHLERLRVNYNNPEPEPEDTAVKEEPQAMDDSLHPVVSIPLDTLINSICESPKIESLPLACNDFKQELEQNDSANISQDSIVVIDPVVDVIGLTDIDERERLIRQAMRSLRKQLKPGKRKRKRSKTNLNTTDEPPRRKPCRNTRIG